MIDRFRRALATLWAVVLWPVRMFRATLVNVREVLSAATPADVIPPWIYEYITSTLAWFRMQVPRVVGYRSTPYEQMTASVVIAVAMVVVSVGVLTWLAPIMLIPFGIGVARLVPAADRVWPLANTRGESPV